MSEDRLRKLEQRLEDVEAKLELYQMFSAFGPSIDSGGDDNVVDFFSEDAEYRSNVATLEPVRGHKAIKAIFTGDMHQGAIKGGIGHVLSFPHIVIDGNKAIVINHSTIFLKGEAGWQIVRVASNRFECERRDGRWFITARDNMALGDPEARALFGDVPYDVPWLTKNG